MLAVKQPHVGASVPCQHSATIGTRSLARSAAKADPMVDRAEDAHVLFGMVPAAIRPEPGQSEWFEPAGLGRTARGLHRDRTTVNTTTLSPASILALSATEARSLTGRQLDSMFKQRLQLELGTKWLMTKQECFYRPERPAYAMGAAPNAGDSKGGPSAAGESSADIALLMVDNRPPMPYYVPGTSLRSPDGWGEPRLKLHAGWSPSSLTAASTFQMTVAINHMYTQLHGYRFYLENPCPARHIGVKEAAWRQSLDAESLRRRPWSQDMEDYLNSEEVCHGLPANHRLGPFPPRGPPWMKLSALRYVLRRHAFVAFMDSDAYVTEIWHPLWPLLNATGLTRGKWIAAAEEYPPQKLRKDRRAGLANSGLLLLAGVPTAGAAILQMMEEWIWPLVRRCDRTNPTIPPEQRLGCNPAYFFSWPYEQNALTTSIFARYPDRFTLLRSGCPLNSPFGAFFRHLVGGTPAISVYNDELRPAWATLALQCTLGIVLGALHPQSGALRVTPCTPNEPTLLLDARGCTALHSQEDTVPVQPELIDRVRAPDWTSCCALCNELRECSAWSHDEDQPAGLMNCRLIRSFASTQRALGQQLGRKPLSAPGDPHSQHISHETFEVPAVVLPLAPTQRVRSRRGVQAYRVPRRH